MFGAYHLPRFLSHSTRLASTRMMATAPSTAQYYKNLGNEEYRHVEHVPYTQEQVEAVKPTHVEPTTSWDKAAFCGVKMVRLFFDIGSGYAFGKITEKRLLRRIIFLETVAGIPGMVAGSLRHLHSLRRIQADRGWIQTLLDEAENERMHLLVFQEIAKPSALMKATVFASQLIAWNAFFAFYLVAPQACHRVVGYIEEEAVHTYTSAIQALDDGLLPTWTHAPCPRIGIEYWGMETSATMRDLLLAVRADEAHHRDVNHKFADIAPDAQNPFHVRQGPVQ